MVKIFESCHFHIIQLTTFLFFLFSEFFAGSDSPYRESLDETLSQLSVDEDRDVSYFATAKREDLSMMMTNIIVDESQA
jgi:hypothetical protein